MRKLLIICIFALVLFFISLYAFSFSQKDDLKKLLEKWGVTMQEAEFILKDFSGQKIGVLTREEIAAERRGTILKIAKIATEAPVKYIEDKKYLLDSLFLPTASPYPGVITNVIECPEEFKPKITAVENGTIYTLYAGERFNYGVCAQDLVAYHSAYGIFDCKDKGIFEVRIFSKDESEPQEIVRSFTC